mgnify:FL=1
MAKTRVKKVVISGITSEQAEIAFSEFATADAKVQNIQSKMDMEITRIRDKYADILAEQQAIREKNFEIMQTFATEHREELFSKRKSYESAHGTFGFRTGTPKLKNVKGFTWASVTNLVKEFLPLLAPGSRIVLIGSTSGIRRDRGGIYGISKWALRSYAYALREECKPMGIGVSLINPGGTFTETRKKSSEEDRSLLETSDLGKVITLTFRLSPQAVLEEVNIRPLQGDTY